MCDQTNQPHVPDFTVTGFDETSNQLSATNPQLPDDIKALLLSVCVSASYNPQTNKICFNVPIFGNVCITSPVPVPVGGELKACASTCGRFIPTGLKATVYLNGNAIWSGVVVGRC